MNVALKNESTRLLVLSLMDQVPVLNNAILCSLHTFRGQKHISGSSCLSRIRQNALKLTNVVYERKRFNNMEILGPVLTENDEKPQKYYLIDVVGCGSTSRAFRAVASKGGECVIKMHLQKYDSCCLIMSLISAARRQCSE